MRGTFAAGLLRLSRSVSGARRPSTGWAVSRRSWRSTRASHSSIGDVDYWSEREDAERAVRNLTGVRSITNKIEVKPPERLPDDVRKSTEDALARHAEREAQGINIELRDGRAVVSGVVHSFTERETVLGAVNGTPGVSGVDDRLRIEPRAA
jgi:osmotically-inducible protein OsmY